MFCTLIVMLAIAAFTGTHAKIPPEMKALMDTSINPCDDFYHYSCGAWLNSNQHKLSDEQLVLAFDVAQRKIENTIQEIADENHPLVSEFWDSCMNTKQITKLGNSPLQRDLARIANAATKADVLSLAGEFSRSSTKFFISLSVASSRVDPTTNILLMNAAHLPLHPDDYFANDSPMILAEYKTYINRLLELSDVFEDQRVAVADAVIITEKKIAKLLARKVKRTYTCTIAEALKRWPLVFGAFAQGVELLEKVSEDFDVHIPNLQYMMSVEKLINSLSLDVLKVYLTFAMVNSRAQWLGDDFNQAWTKFFRGIMRDQQEPLERSKICMDHLFDYMPDLIGEYYYKKVFDSTTVESAMEMFKLIKQSMKERISRATWLNSKAEENALSKLSKVMAHIGEQKAAVKAYPSSLSRIDFPANMKSILSHAFNVQIMKAGQHVNPKELPASTAVLSAYYSDATTSLVIPAAMLQPPFLYGTKVHPARTFGAVGFIIGHELIHGFDNTGKNYDGDGNYRPLWNELTTTVFNIRSKCLKTQYSEFEVKGENGVLGNVQGDFTVKENIADNGGIALAWDAYRKYMMKIKPQGDDVTFEGDKLFFLTFGQMWCTKARDGIMLEVLAANTHAPSQWRVNGALMNNNVFSKVFNCTSNAPMNPSKKCLLW